MYLLNEHPALKRYLVSFEFCDGDRWLLDGRECNRLLLECDLADAFIPCQPKSMVRAECSSPVIEEHLQYFAVLSILRGSSQMCQSVFAWQIRGLITWTGLFVMKTNTFEWLICPNDAAHPPWAMYEGKLKSAQHWIWHIIWRCDHNIDCVAIMTTRWTLTWKFSANTVQAQVNSPPAETSILPLSGSSTSLLIQQSDHLLPILS